MRFPYILFFLFTIVLLSAGCRKEKFTDDPSAKLVFSTDTIHFDTVFVSVGSATQNFKVSNPLGQPLKISNIRLAGGDNSPFRINIDGRPTSSFTDYEIATGDSFYIFVEVTIDPNNQSLPFVVTDSIMFETNGNTQKVILDAFGQNAHFFDNKILGCDTNWVNDGKPYVIYRSAAVPPGCSLTIDKGVKVYSHRGSGLFVYGTLRVNGTQDEPVIFRGDRLERKFETEPGQWYGIRFVPGSSGNRIKHAVISNAYIGVEVDSLPVTGNSNLIIEKTIIKHMTVAGLYGVNSAIEGKNLLIHACEQYTFLGSFGGDYKFTHCTFDDSHNKTGRKTASFGLSNFYVDINEKPHFSDLKTDFRNCIIWGNLEEEIGFGKADEAGFDTTFLYNVVKTKDYKFNNTNQLNQFPKFKSSSANNYLLDSLSPAINAGLKFSGQFLVTDDLVENPRDDKPDLGCYEFKP
ncbi:MAG: hypothetical protein EOP53_02165 [Sphingobacteriales bacterium]|nr:MAG: hypothetical protein EOP53_02165 [Sphingobacteriales bacterium]